jgi:hypothetical protein
LAHDVLGFGSARYRSPVYATRFLFIGYRDSCSSEVVKKLLFLGDAEQRYLLALL